MSIIRTGLSILVELIDLVNSAIIFLPQITLLRWLTFLLGSQTVILTVLLQYQQLQLQQTFPPLGNSDHVVVSVPIDFPSYSLRDAPFHRFAYDYSRANWDGLCDHLRNVPWEGIFKLITSAAASEFCELVQVGIDVYIPHRKYQVKPHFLHGFELLVLLPQFIEITFFVCTERINLLILK